MHLIKFSACQWIYTLSILFCAIVSTQFVSCVSPKSIVYFQGDTARYRAEPIVYRYVPLIQQNDILSIVVNSLNAESNELFNTPNTYQVINSNYSTTAGGGARMQPLGYLVDSDGTITLPLIGKIHVAGIRTQELEEQLSIKLQEYLKEPVVSVRNVNFKISVLGEVARPGVFVIPDERISLTEILSMAGDLTVYGNRQGVILVREEGDKREHIRLDLTSQEIFRSPYYYLRKNDLIYVEPVAARVTSTDRLYQLTPLLVSVLTGLSLLFVRFR